MFLLINNYVKQKDIRVQTQAAPPRARERMKEGGQQVGGGERAGESGGFGGGSGEWIDNEEKEKKEKE